LEVTDRNGIEEERGCRRGSAGLPYLGRSKQLFSTAWGVVAGKLNRITGFLALASTA